MALFFVADENAEIDVAEAICVLGYEVTHAAETASGEPDASLLDIAVEQGRVLITNDKDFGDLVFRRRRPSCGVILVRLPGTIPSAKARLVSQAVRRHGEGLLGAFLAPPSPGGRTRLSLYGSTSSRHPRSSNACMARSRLPRHVGEPASENHIGMKSTRRITASL